MKSFDDWKEEQERIHNDYDAENAWYAGQQSKQAEIDELREMLNKINEAYADGQKSMRKMIKSNEDELQKRIDEAMKWCEKGCVLKAMDILKGNTNEH